MRAMMMVCLSCSVAVAVVFFSLLRTQFAMCIRWQLLFVLFISRNLCTKRYVAIFYHANWRDDSVLTTKQRDNDIIIQSVDYEITVSPTTAGTTATHVLKSDKSIDQFFSNFGVEQQILCNFCFVFIIKFLRRKVGPANTRQFSFCILSIYVCPESRQIYKMQTHKSSYMALYRLCIN